MQAYTSQPEPRSEDPQDVALFSTDVLGMITLLGILLALTVGILTNQSGTGGCTGGGVPETDDSWPPRPT